MGLIMSDGTKRVKVIQKSDLPDVTVRSLKERLFYLPWKPWVKYKQNNNAYFDPKNDCYYLAPICFKKISGKSVGPNVKFVTFSALEAICG